MRSLGASSKCLSLSGPSCERCTGVCMCVYTYTHTPKYVCVRMDALTFWLALVMCMFCSYGVYACVHTWMHTYAHAHMSYGHIRAKVNISVDPVDMDPT